MAAHRLTKSLETQRRCKIGRSKQSSELWGYLCFLPLLKAYILAADSPSNRSDFWLPPPAQKIPLDTDMPLAASSHISMALHPIYLPLCSPQDRIKGCNWCTQLLYFLPAVLVPKLWVSCCFLFCVSMDEYLSRTLLESASLEVLRNMEM